MGAAVPDMDAIADFSEVKNENLASASAQEARRFFKQIQPAGMMFEFVYTRKRGALTACCNVRTQLENASSIDRFESGEIMNIRRYVFDARAIGESEVFKIPRVGLSSAYVTQRFVDRWELTGTSMRS
jgi:hypothetical protein